MAEMTNAAVARVLASIATMLEFDGADSFRVRAYREAARVVDSLAEPVGHALESGTKIPGVGKDLAGKIGDILRTGTTAVYDELEKKYPIELVRLTELQGLGAKRVRTLYDALQIRDRAGLEEAARAGRLRELPGFGEKMEQKILHSLTIAEQVAGRVLLSHAWEVAHDLIERLRRVPGVRCAEIAGSFRRRRETVGDLDLLVCGGDAEKVMDAFVSAQRAADVLARGETKSSIRLSDGLQVDLRLLPEESFGAALMYFTGSKEHNIELRRIANAKGLTLSEYALAREEGGQVVASRTEEQIYDALGLPWIPPELREAHGEIGLAREGRLPRLIEQEDLLGDLHMHTTRSDGRQSIVEMAAAARARGYRYVAMTEHSKSLTMVGGFDEARVRRSVEEIAAARREVPGIEILHGLEVDILADGSLDLDDDALALLDWVVVSLHSKLNQPAEEATARVLKALEHPAVSAMGHPTGRMIGTRPGSAFDMEKVLARAAALGVMMEINAQPDRVDLSDVNARLAREKGVTMVISTDAHSIANLDFMRYGVFAARRAGLTKDDVLNAWPWERVRERLRKDGAPANAGPAEVRSAPETGGAEGPTRKEPARAEPARTKAAAGRAGSKPASKKPASRKRAPRKPAKRGRVKA